jgi:uncharacterized membrane protein YczE
VGEKLTFLVAETTVYMGRVFICFLGVLPSSICIAIIFIYNCTYFPKKNFFIILSVRRRKRDGKTSDYFPYSQT